LLVGAVIGGVFNWAANGCQFNAAGLGYLGTGAASGFLTALTGNPYLGAAVMGVGNSVTTQLSTTGKLDYGQVFGDVVMSVAMAGFGAGVSDKIGPYIDKTVGSVVTNSILKETIKQGVTGFIGGFAVGAGFSAANGASFNDALGNGWSSAKMGFVMGTISGYVKGYIDVKVKTVSNADNAVKPQAKPTTQENTTTQDQVSAFAKENNIFSGQKSLGDKSIVEGYLKQMNDGTFDGKSGAAGFEYKGKTIFTDGNHRMNAAIQFKLSTGSSLYINSLKMNGNFTQANPSQYGYKTFSFPTLKE
jgi:hypothetical protein